MPKVGIVTPKVNSVSPVLEKAEQKVSTVVKKVVAKAVEKRPERPLDLNYDEIYKNRIFAGRNPYTGKAHYVSADFLDRYM